MKKLMVLAGAASLSLMTTAAEAAFSDGMDALAKDSKFYADVRWRYEHVEQNGFANEADASTLRTKLGLQTGTWQNFQGGFEIEAVGHLNSENYNDGVNGQATFPNVTDPKGIEINQSWISWAGLPQTAFKAGRQIVNLDNQRFIGSVGWRQNDQTLDAVVLTNSSVKDLALLYGYVWNVNRIFGDDHAQGDLGTQTHIVHADYALMPWMKVTGYGYFLNIKEAPTLSSRTLGLRLTGDYDLTKDVKFSYTLEGARQADWRNSTLDYDEHYYHIAPGVAWQGWTAQVGYEVLSGSGVANESFQTPLATLHAFNGWADKFLTTPATGLADGYGRLAYKVSGVNDWANGTVLEAIYHNFDAESVSTNYGNEWDMQVSKTFKGPSDIVPPFVKEWSASLKYANFNGDNTTTIRDTKKIWVTLGTKF